MYFKQWELNETKQVILSFCMSQIPYTGVEVKYKTIENKKRGSWKQNVLPTANAADWDSDMFIQNNTLMKNIFCYYDFEKNQQSSPT